jgi:hypothetical protein
MRRVTVTLLLLSSASVLCSAQTYGEHAGQGYAYFSPGVTSPRGSATIQIGGAGKA